MVNTQLIKDRMKEVGIDQARLAEKMGLKRPTVSQKINNIRTMSLNDAERIACVLKIPEDQFGAYFFSR